MLFSRQKYPAPDKDLSMKVVFDCMTYCYLVLERLKPELGISSKKPLDINSC